MDFYHSIIHYKNNVENSVANYFTGRIENSIKDNEFNLVMKNFEKSRKSR